MSKARPLKFKKFLINKKMKKKITNEYFKKR